MALVIKAAEEHIPADPFAPRQATSSTRSSLLDTSQRASIDEILEEIQSAEEYKDQVVHRRTFDPREAVYGE